jgi:hypothetical protein
MFNKRSAQTFVKGSAKGGDHFMQVSTYTLAVVGIALAAAANAGPAPGTAFDVNGKPLANVAKTVVVNDEALSPAIALGIPSGMAGVDATVQSGVVPVEEAGGAFDANDPKTWSDILIFSNFPAGGNQVGGKIEIFSDGAEKFPFDMKATDPKIFAMENDAANTITYSIPGQAQVYTIQETGKEVEVSEPSSIILVLSGSLVWIGVANFCLRRRMTTGCC